MIGTDVGRQRVPDKWSSNRESMALDDVNPHPKNEKDAAVSVLVSVRSIAVLQLQMHHGFLNL